MIYSILALSIAANTVLLIKVYSMYSLYIKEQKAHLATLEEWLRITKERKVTMQVFVTKYEYMKDRLEKLTGEPQ
jgi:hypothetical protein